MLCFPGQENWGTGQLATLPRGPLPPRRGIGIQIQAEGTQLSSKMQLYIKVCLNSKDNLPDGELEGQEGLTISPCPCPIVSGGVIESK